jgi:hypothetical protein
MLAVREPVIAGGHQPPAKKESHEFVVAHGEELAFHRVISSTAEHTAKNCNEQAASLDPC